jgi:predicted transcriptional regulator
MADGGQTIELDEEFAESVRAAAAARGIPFEMFVRDALTAHMFTEIEWSDDPDWAIDKKILDDAIRNGRTIPWSEVRPWVESWGKPDELPPPKWRK